MPFEFIATICASIIACISSVAVAIIQVRASRTARRDKELEESEKRAKAAEDELARQKQDEVYQSLQSQITEMNSNIESFNKEIHKEMKYLSLRVDKVKTETDNHLNRHDENLKKIIDVLSRDARMYSSMMRLHTQTERRLQSLVDIQTCNMQFINETSSTIRIIGEMIVQSSPADSDEAKRLREILDDNKEAHQTFINNLMQAQREFFKGTAPAVNDASIAEAEGDRIHGLIPDPSFANAMLAALNQDTTDLNDGNS